MFTRLTNAVYNTFREVWNLEDPNAVRPWKAGERRGVKTKRVLKRIFAPNAQKQELTTPEPTPAPQMPPPSPVRVSIARDPIKPKTKTKPTPEMKQTAKTEMVRLNKSGKEDPFTEDPRTWNQEIPREDDTAAKRLKEPKRRGKPPTTSSRPPAASFCS